MPCYRSGTNKRASNGLPGGVYQYPQGNPLMLVHVSRTGTYAPRTMNSSATSEARCNELLQLLQHCTTALAAGHGTSIDAGDVGACLAVVAVQLRADRHLQGPVEVLGHDL